VNSSYVGRFEVFVFGGRNTLFSWSQMAFVAPLEGVGGGGVDGILLEEGVGRGSGGGSGSGGLPVSNMAGRDSAKEFLSVVCMIGLILLFI
jgi:hexosaminidase